MAAYCRIVITLVGVLLKYLCIKLHAEYELVAFTIANVTNDYANDEGWWTNGVRVIVCVSVFHCVT